jgi:hypothetical protein
MAEAIKSSLPPRGGLPTSRSDAASSEPDRPRGGSSARPAYLASSPALVGFTCIPIYHGGRGDPCATDGGRVKRLFLICKRRRFMKPNSEESCKRPNFMKPHGT